jgi:restriction system protein
VAARARREAEAEERRKALDQLRHERESLRLGQLQRRIAEQKLVASQQAEATRLTAEANTKVEELRGLLAARQVTSEKAAFGSLSLRKTEPVLTIPKELEQPAYQPTKAEYVKRVSPMAWWEKLFGYRTRYHRQMWRAEQQFQQDFAAWERAEQERSTRLNELHQHHQTMLTQYRHETKERQHDIEDLQTRFKTGDIDAVITYFDIILELSQYPADFPKQFRVAYDPAPKLLAIDYQLPTKGVVPSVAEYRYVKTKGVIEEKRHGRSVKSTKCTVKSFQRLHCAVYPNVSLPMRSIRLPC